MTAPAKPLYGSPCNGCGLCCVMEQCPLSIEVFGPHSLCPALEELPAGGFTCGLIARPRVYLETKAPELADLLGEAFGVILGAGTGCDGVASDADRAIADAEGTALRDRAREHLRAQRREVREVVFFLTGRT